MKEELEEGLSYSFRDYCGEMAERLGATRNAGIADRENYLSFPDGLLLRAVECGDRCRVHHELGDPALFRFSAHLPSITFALARGPAAAAGEIERRLLADARASQRTAEAALAQERAYEERIESLKGALSENFPGLAFGSPVSWRGIGEDRVARWRFPGSDHAQVEVELESADSVAIRFRWLNPDQAGTVLSALKEVLK